MTLLPLHPVKTSEACASEDLNLMFHADDADRRDNEDGDESTLTDGENGPGCPGGDARD